MAKMLAKFLRIACALALCGLLVFGAVEVWLNHNQEMLFRKVQDAVNENLNGRLEIGDFKFRPFSAGFGINFTLTNVKVTDTLYNVHKTAFLNIELIHVALDFNGFYKGDIRIKNLVLQNGSMRMFIRKDGYSNLSIFRSSATKKNDKSEVGSNDGLANKFGHVRFINFAVNYLDSTTMRSYGAVFHDASNQITFTDSTTNARFAGSMHFNGLIFKPENGGFLMKQETKLSLSLGYNPDLKRVSVYPSVLESSTHDKINICGIFNLADTIKTFQLNFKASKIAVDNTLPLLPKIVSQQIELLNIHTMVDTDVGIIGSLSPGKPIVSIHFKTYPFQYNLPVCSLKNVIADGFYTNQGDTRKAPGAQNARLIADDLHGFFETVPFKLKLVINNFADPIAIIDAMMAADSTNLGQLLDPSRYRFNNGKAKINFHFSGSLKKLYDPKLNRLNGKINGKISLRNVSMEYIPRQVQMKKINGELTFDQEEFVFPDLSFSDGQNMLYLQGKVVDLIPYLFGTSKPLRAAININIPSWKLNWLETLLAPRTNVVFRKKKKLMLSALLDDAIDKIEITVKLNSARLKYKRFSAIDLKGEFNVKDNSLRVKYFTMKAFKGADVTMSGELNNSGLSALPHLTLRGDVTNADIQTLFNSFNNFGQQTMTGLNLKGRLSTDFEFETNLSNNVKVVAESMKGRLQISLTNGFINNFSPFLKIKKLIFKKRNFESVQLAPLTANFRLSGQEIEIEPMEIESNVVTLFIDGVYSFGRKTDINIEIPLSNLKKRDSGYVLDPNNPRKRDGSKIFLKAIDETGEVNIKLALKKKVRSKERAVDSKH